MANSSEKSVFETLNSINVNDHTEKKKTGYGENEKKLTYLSWTWAITEIYKRYPNMEYAIKHWDGKPYLYDEALGYMVETSVTIEGQTKEMWLPVMDSHNAAMKTAPYDVETKRSSYTVPAATMMDINKAIMRCLTKNLAMFGLGTYIYAGEDLPEEEAEAKAAAKKETESYVKQICDELKRTGVGMNGILRHYNVPSLSEMTKDNAEDCLTSLRKLADKPEK